MERHREEDIEDEMDGICIDGPSLHAQNKRRKDKGGEEGGSRHDYRVSAGRAYKKHKEVNRSECRRVGKHDLPQRIEACRKHKDKCNYEYLLHKHFR